VSRLPIVCRLLRTKAAFGSEEHATWMNGDSTTDTFWCLNTMEAFGPDEDYAHPHRCGGERACFQAQEHDEPIA
jgi:hypothetical protein